jgi:hypothetical protein
MSEQLKAAKERSRVNSHELDSNDAVTITNPIDMLTDAVDEGFNGAFDAGLGVFTEAGSQVNGFAGSFASVSPPAPSFVGSRHRTPIPLPLPHSKPFSRGRATALRVVIFLHLLLHAFPVVEVARREELCLVIHPRCEVPSHSASLFQRPSETFPRRWVDQSLRRLHRRATYSTHRLRPGQGRRKSRGASIRPERVLFSLASRMLSQGLIHSKAMSSHRVNGDSWSSSPNLLSCPCVSRVRR